MQKLTKKCFKEQMAILCELYGDVSENREKITLKILIDNQVNDELLEKGVMNLCSNRKYNTNKFPQPNELIEFIFGDKQENLGLKIEKAKQLLKEGLRRVGTIKNICFEDPVLHKIIKSSFGSWSALGRITTKDFDNYLKFEFVEAYKASIANGIGIVDRYLEGWGDRQNKNKENFEPSKIYFVGDKEKIGKWHNKLDQIESTGVKQLANSKGVE